MTDGPEGERVRLASRLRSLALPETQPRASHHQPPQPVVEVDLTLTDAPPVHAIVPEAEASAAGAELHRALRGAAAPRYAVWSSSPSSSA